MRRLLSELQTIDLVLILLLIGTGAVVSDFRRQNPGPSRWLRPDQSDHLGAEYNTIAHSIRDGRGFADVFHRRAGPTAWMPPALVYLTAGIYWATGDEAVLVIEIVFATQMLVVAVAAGAVIAVGRSVGQAGWGYASVSVAIVACFFDLFQITHDTWWVTLGLMGLWAGSIWLWDRQTAITKNAAATWGFFGGIAALSSPVLGFGFAVMTTLGFGPWQLIRSRQWLTAWLIAGAVSAAVVTPWMIRNRLMLGRWIPVKSNAVYEIWQSQVLDDDGVLDVASAWQHPWVSNGVQRSEYAEVGEIEFIERRWPPTRDSILAEPVEFLQRVINRWAAACLIYQPLNPADESMTWPIAFRRLFHPIPFVAWVWLVVTGRWRSNAVVTVTVILAAVYLAPYIAISYYDRYAAPAWFLKAMLVTLAVANSRSAEAVDPVPTKSHGSKDVNDLGPSEGAS